MCENAYLSIKNPKASRALKRALDTGRIMLARLCFATSATFGLRSWGPPLDQILDPHLPELVKGSRPEQYSVETNMDCPKFWVTKIAPKPKCTTHMSKLDIFRNPKFWEIHLGSPHCIALACYP